jgi:dephospho-CoA kinase
MKRIGITGGIGSGKSIVSRVLEAMGYPVYDADKMAKALYFKTPIKIAVQALLGTNSYFPDGRLNTAFISSKVFSNGALLKALEQILHPAVKQDFMEWQSQQANHTLLFKESALLFEKHLHTELDAVILVVCDKARRIERVKARDHVSEAEVLERMAKQWPDEKKMELTQLIVKNDEELLVLPQIVEILRLLEHDVLK